MRWFPSLLTLATLAFLPAQAGQKTFRPKPRPSALTPPTPPVPDDAVARAKAEAWKYGGEASFDYLRFKQELAAREVRRWSWTLPQAGGGGDQPLTSSLLNWVPVGPGTLHGYGPSPTDLNAGRPTAIVTHPTAPATLYVAVAGSGVWKSTDAVLGATGDWTWQNLTDTLPSSSTQGNISVGDLAMDPADPETLYLGMGDPLSVKATGFFITHDGGTTWNQGGTLGTSTSVRKILTLGANTLLVATGARQACLYRSTNGGVSFTNTPLPSSSNGNGNFSLNFYALSATAFDATHLVVSGVTYDFTAGAWVRAWVMSTNGGTSWTEIQPPTTFLPSGAASAHTLDPWASNVVAGLAGKGYALVGDATTGKIAKGLYVTSDYGATWAFQDAPTLWSLASDGGQSGYNMLLSVDPADSTKLFAGANLASYRSLDGGLTWEQLTHWYGNQRVYAHADFHVATWSKTGTKTLYIGNDGGLAVLREPYRTTIPSGSGSVPSDTTFLDHTRNKGLQSQLVYTIGSTTAATPTDSLDRVAMGMQDNSTGIRADTGGGMASSSVYEILGTGDGMGLLFHPVDGAKFIAASYNDHINVTSNLGSDGHGSWTSTTPTGTGTFFTPIIPVPSDPTGNSVLTATVETVHKSTDFALSWTALPMTGTDASRNIRRIAASPSNPLVFAFSANITGSSMTGYYTANGGTTWSPFGTFPSNGSAAAGTIWGISIGAADQTLYATSTAYNANASHLWKSLDGGATWVALDGSPGASNGFPFGLPVQFLRESHGDPATLYAGTDFGLYRSQDGGATWARLGTGLPFVQVTDLYEAPDGSFLRVGTYGRGAWEIRLTGGLPTISSFTANPATLTAGGSTTLSWAQAGATSLILTPGNVDVTGLTSLPVSPAATTTYTLTATNASGSVSAQTTVTVVAPPVISGFSASPSTLPTGGIATLTATFSGGVGTVDHGIGTVTSGVGASTGALTASTTYTLTVTNAAGTSVTATALVTVNPVGISLSPTPSHLGAGVSQGFTATVTNAANTGVNWSVSAGSLSALSGATVTFTAPATPGTVTLTATSVQDPSRQVVLTIQVTSLDLDGGGTRDVLDLGLILQAYTGPGNVGAPNYLAAADLDGDGDVDDADLALFLLQF